MKSSHTFSFRWVILSLLFIATTVLYIDRSALGILAPELQKSIGWTEEQYGLINSVFMIAYAICFIVMGKLIDRIGTRKGYLLSIGIWSIATLAHALARSWIGFAFARGSLAIGQSGNFPSAIKAVAEWFPKKDRAFAVSVFNGGANVGSILSPLIIPVLVLNVGFWQIGFLWTFPISLLWMVGWWFLARQPKENQFVSKTEYDYIHSDTKEEEVTTENAVKWKDILPHRATWAIAVAKFFGDPIWWFYLFWGAKFLNERFGLNLQEIGIPFFTIYLVSWLIGILIGKLSSRLLNLGLNKGRKLSLLTCAVCAIPVALVPHTANMWLAVGLIALAAGGHCGWSANVFSLMSDIFPKKAVGTVSGFGGFAGALGGAIIAYAVGKILQDIGLDGYAIPFAIAGCGYLIALLIVHLLVPKIKNITLS